MKKIGIITALLGEAKSITTKPVTPGIIITINKNICLLVSGMGRDRARDAAQKLAVHGCDGLISWGTAGALQTNISTGALIIPEAIIIDDEETIPTARNWRRKIVKGLDDCPADVYLGTLSDTMQVLTSSKSKYAARDQNDAIAVDMESATIAKVAKQENVPFIAIRSISDSANMTIPETILSYTDPYGEVELSKLMAALLRRPGDIPKIIRLGLGYASAKKTLKWSASKLVKLLSENN